MEGRRHRGGQDNRKEGAKEAGDKVQRWKGGRMERERERINCKRERREVMREEKD